MTNDATTEDWLKRGVAWLEEAAPAQAAACFRRCVAIDPQHVGALWQLGQLEATLERRFAAIALLRWLLALSPGFEEARVMLARMEAALGWFDLAHGRFAKLGHRLTGFWEAVRVERLTAVRKTRAMLAGVGPAGGVNRPAVLAEIAQGRLSLGHLPACAAALDRLETLRQGCSAAAEIRARLILRQAGLPAALAFMRALPDPVRASLRLPYARMLYEAGDFAGVEATLGTNAEEQAALHLLTLSHFASGARQEFLDASKRWLARCGSETPPCRFAIAAARHQGMAVRLDDAPAADPVPRTALVQYWHERKLPADVAACMASWPAQNPSLHQRILCRDEARDIIAAQKSPDILACFDEAPHAAVQSDIIRLVVLAQEGGLYIDADERCVAPLTPLLQRLGTVEFVGWLSPDTPSYLYNGFLAVRQGSSIIRSALEDMISLRRNHRARGVRSDVWQVSGPGLITRAVARALSDPRRAGTIMLLTDREWRRFAHTDETLAYKHSRAGNWRLL